MSFFDDFPLPPPPPEPRPRQRDPWDGPPAGGIGGWVPWRIVLARSDTAYAALRDFEAFPSGLHFALVMRFKEGRITAGPPMRMRQRQRLGHTAEALRLGVRFADGRKAATGRFLRADDHQGDEAYPVFRPGGGGGSSGEWRMSYWLWPLPPPGPLTWLTSWPEAGVSEAAVEVDAAILAAAADEAEQLWEEDDGRSARGYTQMTSTLRASEPQAEAASSDE